MKCDQILGTKNWNYWKIDKIMNKLKYKKIKTIIIICIS